MSSATTAYPTLPAPQCGNAGYGVHVPEYGWLSDAYNTPEDATTAAQAALVLLHTGTVATLDAATMMAGAMMAEPLGEWSDMAKDMWGFRPRNAAALEQVRASYWQERYDTGGAVPCY